MSVRAADGTTIWRSGVTVGADAGGLSVGVELGVKFRSDVAGYISGIRFYKYAQNMGTHTGSLWTTGGARLGQATFTSETASGWQEARFETPVAIAANTTYIASYFAPTGHFAFSANYFTAAGIDNSPLHALRSGVDGPNGVFRFGSTSSFPNSSYQNGNYWVDVLFSPPCSTPGVPSNLSPANGAAWVSTNVNLRWSNDADTYSYDVYFGTSSPPPKVGNTSGTSYSVSGLSNGTLYYWQVVARNECGDLASGPTWAFVANDSAPMYVNAFAIDPQASSTIYRGTTDSERTTGNVFKSTKGGTTWRPTASITFPHAPVNSFAVNPLVPDTLYAGTDTGVFKSTDGGASWAGSGLTGMNVRAIAVDPEALGILYAGTQNGVFKSTNSGMDWTATDVSGIDVYSLAINSQIPSTLYAGTWGGLVFKSTDSGLGWSAVNEPFAYAFVTSLAIDPQSPETVYAGTSGGVFKSTDGGTSWSAVNNGIDYTYILSLAIDPQASETVYSGNYAGSVFKSTDGGASWSAMNTGISGSPVNALTLDPQSPEILYIGTWGEGVFKIEQEPCAGPVIGTHPQSQTIQSGQTATMSVSASGTTPLSYQWYRGSSGDTSNPISGATSSSYTTPALTQTTSYWVRVSNSCGYADSNTAAITVASDTQAPIISNVHANNITQTTAEIFWDLDEYGTGQVEYGTTVSLRIFIQS